MSFHKTMMEFRFNEGTIVEAALLNRNQEKVAAKLDLDDILGNDDGKRPSLPPISIARPPPAPSCFRSPKSQFRNLKLSSIQKKAPSCGAAAGSPRRLLISIGAGEAPEATGTPSWRRS